MATMFTITLKRSFAALTVTAGLLAAAGPAGAVLYNGHAGLGSAVYQHNQTDLEFVDGTSNTLQTGPVARP